MNRKQLLTLLVLVAVVGGAGLLLHQKNQAAWHSADKAIGQKLLGNNFPINDVALIAIKQGSNQLDLAKKDNLWRVRERNDYPASFSQISEFLIKAADLKVVQSEKVGPSQLSRFALAPGQGTNAPMVIEFKDQGGKLIRSLFLGKKHFHKSEQPSSFGGDMGDEGWPDGRFVKVGSEAADVALISDALSNIEPKPEQWLNKDFPKIEKIRSIAATFQNPTNSWKLTRETETGEWKLADPKPGEQLDASKTSGVASPLASLSFTDIAAGAKPETLGLDKPAVVAIGTFDNFSYTLKIGQKTNDNYPLTLAVTAQIPNERQPGKDEKPQDKTKLDKEFKDNQKKLEDKLSQDKTCEPWIYLVSTWTVEPLLKERSQLMAEKKEEPKKDEKPPAATGVAPPKPPDTAKPADATPKPADATPKPSDATPKPADATPKPPQPGSGPK
jgi:hypothetical protein